MEKTRDIWKYNGYMSWMKWHSQGMEGFVVKIQVGWPRGKLKVYFNHHLVAKSPVTFYKLRSSSWTGDTHNMMVDSQHLGFHLDNQQSWVVTKALTREKATHNWHSTVIGLFRPMLPVLLGSCVGMIAEWKSRISFLEIQFLEGALLGMLLNPINYTNLQYFFEN